MDAKEKAKDLVNKYDETLTYLESKKKAKQCALIAVDELIIQQTKYNNATFYPSKYWDEVKHEIINL